MIQLKQACDVTVNRLYGLKGKFHLDHFIKATGEIKSYELDNAVTNAGKNLLFNVMFYTTSKSTTWYIGIIDNAAYSASPVTDTMSSHAGWAEFTDYSQSTRVTWGAGAASSQSITNASASTFDITGSGTLRGIFVADNSTKSGTSGTLWSTALFNATLAVTNGDQIKITYTVSA